MIASLIQINQLNGDIGVIYLDVKVVLILVNVTVVVTGRLSRNILLFMIVEWA